MSNKISVLNPLGYPPKVTGKALAPGLESLNGKTVYLVDVRFDNSDVFMEQLQGWFTEHMPTVTTRFARWHEPFADDPELSAEIKADGDAAILGVGL